jgi:uncharacterized protein YebE (UPF0316 family)
MNLETFSQSWLYLWVLLPLLIFGARVLDVSLGTLRIVFVSRGLKYLAPLVGFFEVIIWLLAIRVIMQNLNNVACYVAYGAGFAMGNYAGIYLEKKLALGRAILRIITRKDAAELIQVLREEGFGVTAVKAQGSDGDVNLIFMVIRRSDFITVRDLIRNYNPRAFYTLEDVRFVSEGTFPEKEPFFFKNGLTPFKYFRKGK